MTMRRLMGFVILFCATTGCYMPISGRVIDLETQQPIEGAVVLVEWTKTHGFGEHWTESAKVAEVVSDKEGRVELPGCYDPFVQPPDITIYTKGYVAWNNYLIFRGMTERRIDYEWKSGYVFKLEKYAEGYSYIDHQLFVLGIAHLSMASNKKMIFRTYYLEAEREMILKEQKDYDRARGLAP